MSKATSSAVAPAAKGQLVVGNGVNTAGIVAVGANGTVLTADSAEATGLKWAAPAGGGANYTLLNAGGTALTGASTITISGISGREKFLVRVDSASATTGGNYIRVRINGDSGSNYQHNGNASFMNSIYASTNNNGYESADSSHPFGSMANGGGSLVSGAIFIDGGTGTGTKSILSVGGGNGASGTQQGLFNLGGLYFGTAAITSISVVAASNFDGGTVFVYAS